MSERLIEIRQTELNPTLRALSDAGMTVDDAAWIRKGDNASLVARLIHDQRDSLAVNPFRISAAETLERLSRANLEQWWGICPSVIAALADSAPRWPGGHRAFRSLRIRWGEGDGGVRDTAERHIARVRRTFAPNFWRWEYLRTDTEHLKLAAGSRAHRPAVGWVTFDLDENRERESVEAVRGPHSLADEGLAFAWLFPEYVRAIDYEDNPAFFLAGYELTVPGCDGHARRRVPFVGRGLLSGRVHLDAFWLGDDDSGYSVPSSRECRP